MKVIAAKKIPPTEEFIEDLKHEFSDRYAYKSFGAGSNKSIIIHKSTFIGVEISVNKNEIFIEAAPPTMEGAFFTAFLQFFSGLGMSITKFASPFYKSSPWIKLENEVGAYLQHKFNE